MAEKIKITFLGTGSAVPTQRRNHPSVLLEYKDEGILLDCGEGVQRQFRFSKKNPCKISRIFISHWHGDHVFGLPGLLQTLSLNEYNKTLYVYGPDGTKKIFEIYKKMFIEKKNSINVEINEMKNEKIEIGDFEITAKEMFHDCPCIAFSFKIKDKYRLDKEKLRKLKIPNSPLLRDLQEGKTIKINGKKIEGEKLRYLEKGKKLSYLTDTRINKNIHDLIKDSDLLISEATYSSKEKELADKYFHLTSEQIAKEAKKANVKKLILFHLSQRYDKNPELLLNEAKKIFKETQIAEDFMELEL